MTEIRTETFALTDGRSLRLTVAGPEPAVRGGLIVLHEARGVTGAVRGLVASLAAEGWLAVAPHLYGAENSEEFEGADVDAQVSQLSGEKVLADTDATAVWLAQRGVPADRLGVIGFDLGGAAALVVASSRTVGAAVSVAGGGILEPLSDGLPALVDVARELTCPWLGLYADGDENIPVEQVEKLRDAAAHAEVATEVVRFAKADNRIDRMESGDAEVDPKAAQEAWARTLNWFDLHLR